jgi:mRNA-degrading endonuclease RelE of RelBE toxin-antitoxin system
MSYNIIAATKFKKELKKLSKKYASLDSEIEELFDELEENPTMGTLLRPNVYKIRLAISSKNKGKSGGARVITYIKIIDETVYLLSIYSKGEKDNISEDELDDLLTDYQE